MKPADLEAARSAAVSALGRGGERALQRLEAAGLVVVRAADLPAERGVRTLEGVTLRLREPWDALEAPVFVETAEGERLEAMVLPGAVAAVREAHMLQQVTGRRVGLTLSEHGDVQTAWTED